MAGLARLDNVAARGRERPEGIVAAVSGAAGGNGGGDQRPDVVGKPAALRPGQAGEQVEARGRKVGFAADPGRQARKVTVQCFLHGGAQALLPAGAGGVDRIGAQLGGDHPGEQKPSILLTPGKRHDGVGDLPGVHRGRGHVPQPADDILVHVGGVIDLLGRVHHLGAVRWWSQPHQ